MFRLAESVPVKLIIAGREPEIGGVGVGHDRASGLVKAGEVGKAVVGEKLTVNTPASG